jgi:arylsulfatase A-like enzyme
LKKWVVLLILILWLSLDAVAQPNIIFILCDDLGYGDLGVLYQNARTVGMPKFATPQLDAFASEGMQLRRHYCPSPMCAPSRASLLLGVHQGHANVRNYMPDAALENNHTLATVLKQAGYATAAIGKWGLQGKGTGEIDPATWPAYPTKRGFDYYFGYVRHKDGHEHYPKEGLSDGPKEVWESTAGSDLEISAQLDKCFTTDLFTARAKKWIVDHRGEKPNQPFFMYLAFDTPHTPHQSPTQAYPAGGGLSGGLQWLGTPGAMINTANGTVNSYIHPDYINATYDHDNDPATPEVAWMNTPAMPARVYATSVRRIDEAVGDLKKLLKDLQIDTNTLVVFTSDNGPATPCNFFDSFGPFDGTKFDCWEGGVREPTFVCWPGTIASNRISYAPSQSHDWMPTFAEVAGVPAPARTDGVSLVPTLTGAGTQRPSTIYVEYDYGGTTPDYVEFDPAHRDRTRNEMQMVYVGEYAGVRYNITSHADNFEIHNTLTDPQQTNNLALSLPAVQQQMKDRVLQVRRPATHLTPYDTELIPPVTLAIAAQGLTYRAYEGVYPWVPDFTPLTPVAQGTTSGLSLGIRTRDANIGLLYTGYLNVPADGTYTFYLAADSKAFLRLHDASVIDADYGYSGGGERTGSIKLKAGLHPFRLAYARGDGGVPSLALKWNGPGLAKQVIPDSAFVEASSNHVPAAQGQSLVIAKNMATNITLAASDADGDPLTYSIVTPPVNGILTGTPPAVVYAPATNFAGNDSFSFTAFDGQATSVPATVSIRVARAAGPFLVVDWGGTYCSSAQSYSRSMTVETNMTDYGGSVSSNDTRRYVPFSESVPLSPSSLYSGTNAVFYGGWNAICYDAGLTANTPLNNRLRVGPATGSPNFLEFGFAKAPATGEVAAVAVWVKGDFLTVTNETLILTSNCTLRINILASGIGTTNRLVVKNGSQYYVSSTWTNTAGGWLTIADPTRERWATFNPANPDNRLRDVGSTYEVRQFDDVQALGYYVQGRAGFAGTSTYVIQVSEVEFMAASFVRASSGTVIIVK